MEPCYDKQYVCKAVKEYLTANKISNNDVARKLNISSAAVSTQLSGRKAFGPSSAVKWSTIFPFNIEFLLYGKGELLKKEYHVEGPAFEIKTSSEYIPASEDKLHALLQVISEINNPCINNVISRYYGPGEIYSSDVRSDIETIQNEFGVYESAFEFAKSLDNRMNFKGTSIELYLTFLMKYHKFILKDNPEMADSLQKAIELIKQSKGQKY